MRRAGPKPTVNIIAHSYGTTMSADALATGKLGVNTFVMLGSAGVEERIGNAGALHVPHVFAGEAAADPEARLGRASRTDSRSPSFGATILSVEGDLNSGLTAVTGHDPVLHSPWNDDLSSSAWSGKKNINQAAEDYVKHILSYGYLDTGTESLENAAIATTPNANRPLYH